MTKCKSELFEFPRVKGRKVEVNFSGGHVTSDGGTLLVSQADRLIKSTELELTELTVRQRVFVYQVHLLVGHPK